MPDTPKFPHGNAWAEQKAAIDRMVADLHIQLETVGDWESACRMQGQVAALRQLLTDAEPAYRPGKGSATY